MKACRDLLRAWIALLALSAATTLLVRLFEGGLPLAAGGAMILLSLVKADVILTRYLELAAVPAWRAGFRAVLSLLGLLLFALYAAPALL